MKKLIYSQEDVDLILSLETQEYEDKIKKLQNDYNELVNINEKLSLALESAEQKNDKALQLNTIIDDKLKVTNSIAHYELEDLISKISSKTFLKKNEIGKDLIEKENILNIL